LLAFVGVGGEGWHHASWRRFLVLPLKSPACRRGLTSRIMAQVFGAAAEVSCLSERADITHHGAGFLVLPPKSPACRRGLTSRIMAQVLVQPPKSPACRRGLTSRIMAK